MNTTQVAVDLAKSVFEIAVSHRPGKVHESHRLSRGRFQKFFTGRESVEILMEACGTAHHWGRTFEEMGHRVTLLPPGDVSRYRDGNKTDRADAKALLEAARNDRIDPVPVKSVDQQAIAALHRIRSGYQQTRTARINAVRGHLREFGIVIPVGALTIAIFSGLPPSPATFQTQCNSRSVTSKLPSASTAIPMGIPIPPPVSAVGSSPSALKR